MGTGAALLVSTGIQVAMKYSAAKKEQQAWEYNAGITEGSISAIEAARKTQELRSITSRQRLQSAQIAAVASSGIELKGSPIEVLNADLARAEFDIAVDNYNFEVEKTRTYNDAQSQRYSGKQAYRTGLLDAAGSGVQGAATAYRYREKPLGKGN